jgi:hypothetical protein
MTHRTVASLCAAFSVGLSFVATAASADAQPAVAEQNSNGMTAPQPLPSIGRGGKGGVYDGSLLIEWM